MAQVGFKADKPALSIVIASVNGHHYIARCLSSLERQHAGGCAEVIVVECSGDDTAARIAIEHPWAVIIPVSSPEPIPNLRSRGLRHARGDILVTTEDHCLFPEDWFDQIIRAHNKHSSPAIGGAVENGSCEHLMDWAAYLCDYAKFMLPLASGPEVALPGPNVSYKREALEHLCGDLLNQGVWESTLHERLVFAGMDLCLDPAIVVYHAKAFSFREFLTQRYHFGRSFAAARVARASPLTRGIYLSISLFLPPLFLLRYAKCFMGKQRFIKEFIKTLPLQVIFAVAWSVGEFFGYGWGDGGSSLRVK